MSPKSKAILTGGTLFVLTALVTIFREVGSSNVKAIWLIFAGFSWNIFAYGFDRGMWPRTFVELDGRNKGNPVAREAVFWLSATVYLALMATFACA